MEKKVVFSEAFRGFNKKDVTDYLENAALEKARDIEKLNDELSKLRDKLDDVTAERDTLLTKLAHNELREPLDIAQSRVRELELRVAYLEEFETKYCDLKKYFDERIREINTLADKNTKLTERNEKLELELADHINEKMSIAQVILKAQRSADEITRETEQSCQQMREQAMEYISMAKVAFRECISRIEYEKGNVVESIEKINAEMGTLFKAVNTLDNEFADKYFGQFESDVLENPNDTDDDENDVEEQE